MDRKRAHSYHEEGPDGVVEEDDGGGHQHGETDELVELGEQLAPVSSSKFGLRKRLFKIERWRHQGNNKRTRRNRGRMRAYHC